jgi:hypothetical protein
MNEEGDFVLLAQAKLEHAASVDMRQFICLSL